MRSLCQEGVLGSELPVKRVVLAPYSMGSTPCPAALWVEDVPPCKLTVLW